MGEETLEPWATVGPDGDGGHQFRRAYSAFAWQFEPADLSPQLVAKAAASSDLRRTDRHDRPWLSGLPRIILLWNSEAARKPVKRHPGMLVAKAKQLYRMKEIVHIASSRRGRRHQWLCLTESPHTVDRLIAQHHAAYGIRRPNLWIGTTVTGEDSLRRVAELVNTGGSQTRRFVCVEPLWQSPSLQDFLDDLHWVVIGGQSGRSRDCEPLDCEWARRLIGQCREAKVPVFLNQLGGHAIDREKVLPLQDSFHGGCWSEWPLDLRVRQVPSARLNVV